MRILALLVCAAALCAGSTISLAPECVRGTLADYIALKDIGCSEPVRPAVDAVFFNFGFASNGGGPLRETDISITPSFTPSSGSLSFEADFFADTGQSFSYLIFYTVDPPPIIHGSRLDMDAFSPKDGGRAIVTTEICQGTAFTNPLLGNECRGNLFTLKTVYDTSVDPPFIDLSAFVFFDRVDTIGVRTTVTLDGNKGTSQINGFSNSALVTPEPGTWLTGAVGFGLLALLRRRRRGHRG